MITKNDAKKFLEDFENGDILAITNLEKRKEQSLIDKNDVLLNKYLFALKNLNEIIIEMEDETIPWDSDFNDIYRGAMALLYEKCKEISTNPTINILTVKWYDDCLKHNIPVSPSDIKDLVEELIEMGKENE